MSRDKKKRRKGPPTTAKSASDGDTGGKSGGGLAADGSGEAPRHTAFDSFRENVESLVIAIILAVIIRHFAVEAFEIPTGSMAPTLYGMHAWVDSPNCDFRFPVGLPSDSVTEQVDFSRYAERLVYEGECPSPRCKLRLHGRAPGRRPLDRGGQVECQACGERFDGSPQGYRLARVRPVWMRCPLTGVIWEELVETSNLEGGHKILVNKFAFQVGDPRRFDVVVFGFDQWKNYIKRLVGLPGERIQIVSGDLYVDGKIVRKSDHPYVQEHLWRKVSDSDVLELGLAEEPAWVEPDAGRVPSFERLPDGRWSLNHPASEEPAVLRFTRGFDNYVPYNLLSQDVIRGPSGGTSFAQVGDVRLELTVTPASGSGWIGAQIRDGDFEFRVRIPVGKPREGAPARIERVVAVADADAGPPRTLSPPVVPPLEATAEGVALAFGRSARLTIENVDDRVAVHIDGEEVLRLDYTSCPNPDDPPRGSRPEEHHLWILGAAVQANVSSIRLHQDLHYLSGARYSSIELGEDEYFVLGDNSPSSSDGRYWGHVDEKSLMGKALLVFWPAWPTRDGFQCKFIR